MSSGGWQGTWWRPGCDGSGMTRNRRDLGRRLNSLTDASVAEVLAMRGDDPPAGSERSRRIGFTGPPGVGKSSLIGALARRRVEQGVDLAVLCIDPTSPLSGGSILGDRIRIDADVASDVFVRSVPSRQANDGLTDNLPDLLAALDRSGDFDEIWVETVGVGQAAYGIRRCVDTIVVLVLPGSGDSVQAMKAGILEVGDVYVVTKGDQPGADRMAAELAPIIGDVIVTSTVDGRGIDELLAAIDRRDQPAPDDRSRYDVERLITRRVRELLSDADVAGLTLRQSYHHIIHTLEGEIA